MTTIRPYRLQVTPRSLDLDSRGRKIAGTMREWFHVAIDAVHSREVYSIFARLSDDEAKTIAAEIGNPVIQEAEVGESAKQSYHWMVIIGFLPGVTDNVASTARTAIGDILGRPLGADEELYSSTEFLIDAPTVTRAEIETIAVSLLGNPLIHSIQCLSYQQVVANGLPVNRPKYDSYGTLEIQRIALPSDDEGLSQLSQTLGLALSVKEMRAICSYYQDPQRAAERQSVGLDSQPTDAEIEVFAQTWSEHCKHKIFDAIIDYEDEDGRVETITSLYRSFIKKSTHEIGQTIDWLVSIFSDNAGVIAFNDQYDLVYKVETHNSPSALDPYGGAMTGIVGVNRDPLGTGMGAELLVNVWGYCFGSPFTRPEDVPPGLLHPRRIRDGVHQGVIDGGNQSGIPYGFGWEYFDQRFIGKPLVFCGTVGCLPKTLHGKRGAEKAILPGDLVVMAGGRIGKDGIHGATFSSAALQQNVSAQVVQIGDPITQKCLSDFLLEARNQGLYRFITDNGAGGLSSSVGEMSTHCHGARIDLRRAPLKYQGLQPWEILLSESQERMTLAVPPEHIRAFTDLAARRDVEVTVLGEFTNNGKFHVLYGERTVAYLDVDYLFQGCPRMRLAAQWRRPRYTEPTAEDRRARTIREWILALLTRLNIGSNETKARQYDHEVKGLSVVKPFVGVHADVAADATVFMIAPMAKEGFVLTAAALPRYSDIDAFHMTASVIDVAIRRAIAAGANIRHIAALDNFCWPDPVAAPGNPDGPYKLAQLVRANQALYRYTTAFGVPCVSGKDSMKNDSVKGGIKISVPPTLLFSIIAKIDDISQAVTLEAKNPGDWVYVVGVTKSELGGSEYHAALGYVGNDVPGVEATAAYKTFGAMAKAISRGLCHSAHAPALGGLAIGFAKIAMGGRLGLEIQLDRIPIRGHVDLDHLLFSESNSRFIVTVPQERVEQFEDTIGDVPWDRVGQVTDRGVLCLRQGTDTVCEIDVQEMVAAYKRTLSGL